MTSSDKKKVLLIGSSGLVGMATRDAITQYLGADVLCYDDPAASPERLAARKVRIENYKEILEKRDRLVDNVQAHWLLGESKPLAEGEQGKASDIDSIRSAINEGVSSIIITSGAPRKAGEVRSDLLKKNTPIFKDLGNQIADIAIEKLAENKDFKLPVMINAGNPMDAMTEVLGRTIHERLTEKAKEVAGIDKEYARALAETARSLQKKVIGQGGVLDGARAAMAIQTVADKYLGIKLKLEDIVSVPVVGTHGEDMVVDLDHAQVKYRGHTVDIRHLPGFKLDKKIIAPIPDADGKIVDTPTTVRDEITRQTRSGGKSIISDYKEVTEIDTSAVLATAAALKIMTNAVLENSRETMAAAVYHPPLLNPTKAQLYTYGEKGLGQKLKDGFVMGHMTGLGENGAIDVELNTNPSLSEAMKKAETVARKETNIALGR